MTSIMDAALFGKEKEKMRVLSLEEIKFCEDYIQLCYDLGNGPADFEGGPSEWDQKLLHTAREYHRLRKALEFYTDVDLYHHDSLADKAREALKESEE